MNLLSSISKREKILFIISILLISLGIIYSFVISPLYKQYTGLNQEIRIKQARLAKNLKLLQEANVIREEFKNYSHQLKTPRTQEEEMALVLAEIEKIGKVTGIYLSDVKPQKIKEMDFYKVMLVEIRFQTDMQTLSKFLYELQNSTFLLKPLRIQINSKGGDIAILDGTIQISRILLS